MKLPTDWIAKSRRSKDGATAKAKLEAIAIFDIQPLESEPRRNFDQESILSLAESIQKFGILEPLVVRKSSTRHDAKFELIAGERRLRAARIIGLTTVPCTIVSASDAETTEMALVGNFLRDNLNMFEEAQAFSDLSAKYNYTQEEIAAKLSLNQPAVANKMRLLRFTCEEQDLIIRAGLFERHARAILRLPSKQARIEAIHLASERKWTVADTEKYIENWILSSKNDGTAKTANKGVNFTSDYACGSIKRYMDKLCSSSDLIHAERIVDDAQTIIKLTIRRDAI